MADSDAARPGTGRKVSEELAMEVAGPLIFFWHVVLL